MGVGAVLAHFNSIKVRLNRGRMDGRSGVDGISIP